MEHGAIRHSIAGAAIAEATDVVNSDRDGEALAGHARATTQIVTSRMLFAQGPRAHNALAKCSSPPTASTIGAAAAASMPGAMRSRAKGRRVATW